MSTSRLFESVGTGVKEPSGIKSDGSIPACVDGLSHPASLLGEGLTFIDPAPRQNQGLLCAVDPRHNPFYAVVHCSSKTSSFRSASFVSFFLMPMRRTFSA